MPRTVLVTLLLLTSSVVRADEVSDALAEANRLYQARQYPQAVAACDQVIHLDAKHVDAHVLRGHARVALDRLDDAAADAETAVRLAPTSARAHNLHGWVAYRRGFAEQARASYDEALRLAPRTAPILANRALLYSSVGALDRARADYDAVLDINAKNALALLNRGHVRRRQGDLDGAVADFHRAAEVEPRLAAAHVARGDILRGRNDLDKALSAYEEAVKGNAGVTALVGRGETYRLRGDLDRAFADFTEALKLQGYNTEAHIGQARIHLARQELDRAEKAIQAALIQLEKLPAAYELRAALRVLKGDTKGARQDEPHQAHALSSLAKKYESEGDFPAARAARRAALALWEKKENQEAWRVADARRALADIDRLAALSADARLALVEGTALDRQTQAFEGRFRAAEALASAERALALRRRVLSPDSLEIAAALTHLGLLLRKLGDHARAALPLQEAADVRRKVLGDTHPLTAVALNNLGLTRYTLGDYARAEPLLRQASATLGQLGDGQDPAYWASLNNLGVLRLATGDRAGAEDAFGRVLALVRASDGPSPSVVEGEWSGLFDSASAEYYWSLAVRGTYAPPDPGRKVQEATTLGNLGLLRLARGVPREAEPLFAQSLALLRAAEGKSSPRLAATLNNLAMARQTAGDLEGAEAPLREVLELRRNKFNPNDPLFANSLSNLGLLLLHKGQAREAEELLSQSLKIRQLRGPAHLYTAISHDNLGLLAEYRGDHAQAAAQVRAALAIARGNLIHASVIQSERQQLAMLASVRGYLDHFLSASARAGRPADEGYTEVLAWKGAVFARQQRQRDRRAAVAAAPETAALFDDLDRTARQLANCALVMPTSDFDAKKVRERSDLLTRHKEERERELARRTASVGAGRSAEPTPAELARRLPPRSALVDFLEFTYSEPPADGKGAARQEPRLTAFVLRPGAAVRRIDLGPIAPIEAAVDRWRRALSRSGDLEAAAVVRRLVWEPVEEATKDASLLLISPDGCLGRLPFAALPGAKPGSRLIEDHALVLVPVPRLLDDGSKSDKDDPPALLLVGDVDFSASRKSTTDVGRVAPRLDRRYDPLPGTRAEADAVRATFAQTFPKARARVLSGAAASEAAVRDLLPTSRWVHLATHGFFAAADAASALNAGPPSGENKDPKTNTDLFGREGIAGFHPGLLSGLVLAGANRPPEPGADDGILTALEVAELDLSRLQTVVLSACQTGLGKEAGGEGLLGLQRAFQVAGARTVVASLWPVPDEATRVLMERFYRNLWEKKMSKLAALREAQLWMLKEGKAHPSVARSATRDDLPPVQDDGRLPPYYWAAFVLSGDGR